MAVAEQFGDYMGRRWPPAPVWINPEVIVIGGGVSKAGEIILEYVKNITGSMPIFPAKIRKSAWRRWEMTRGFMAAPDWHWFDFLTASVYNRDNSI